MTTEPQADSTSDVVTAGAPPVLAVEHLTVTFPSDDGPVHAVDDLSYVVHENETLGIVGESGSGKSVSSMALLGLLPSTAQVTGTITFKGREILGESTKLKEARLRDI